MKRRLAALALAAAMVVCVIPSAAAVNIDQNTAVTTIQILGIMNGDENGNLNLGSNVTRAEFAKLMIAASEYKDNIGQGSNVSPFKDVKYTHWAASYIRAAVAAGWLNGYTDGTFRPDDNIKVEEAATAVLKMLGYTTADFAGGFPQAQMNKYQALELDDNIVHGQGQYISRLDCVYLFYNLLCAQMKTGGAYCTKLGYTVNSVGELDYSSLVASGIKGPFVVGEESIDGALPFSLSGASVYRNGERASAEQIALYDVYYYNADMKTVWAYHNMVTGVYSAATPNTAAPASVTVAGRTYPVTTAAAVYSLSEMGEFKIGDTITLLLGMNGDVVAALQPQLTNGVTCAMVCGTEVKTFYDNLGNAYDAQVIRLVTTEGVELQYIQRTDYVKVGKLVQVVTENGQQTVKGLAGSTAVTGTVNAAGTAIGAVKFAENVRILDTLSDGSYMTVYPSRLAGVRLTEDMVRCSVTDSNGAISDLILDNATGDLNTYAFLEKFDVQSVPDLTGDTIVYGSYELVIGGAETKLTTTDKKFDVKLGAVSLTYENGVVSKMENISSIELTGLTTVYAMSQSKQYELIEGVEVYVKQGDSYIRSNLTVVSDMEKYSCKAYYDRTFETGGRIRIIVAEEKA